MAHSAYPELGDSAINKLLDVLAAGRVEARKVLEIPAVRLKAVPGIETTVVAYTTDIPAFGGSWGQPLLIGPGTIHVAHTNEERVGKKYRDAMKWHLGGGAPDAVADLAVEECKPGNAPKLLFSATDASVATEIERAFAQSGHVVVSNSRNHRMEPDVPLLVPEINPDHLKVIPAQQHRWGWTGQIVTNPNCSTVVLTMGLAALKPFGIT